MFERGFYTVPDGHANSMPMQALFAEGGVAFYGLYKLIHEITLSSEGMILEKNIYLLGKNKSNGELKEEEVKKFIEICLEQGVFEQYQEPPEENLNPPMYYRVVESSEYLWWYREQKEKKSKACSEAGKKSAEVRAEQKNNQANTTSYFSNPTASNYQQLYNNR